jgi:hypothetical protein
MGDATGRVDGLDVGRGPVYGPPISDVAYLPTCSQLGEDLGICHLCTFKMQDLEEVGSSSRFFAPKMI